MNSYERVLARLQGLPVDRPPNFNIFMTFAVKYINRPLAHYYRDFRVLVEANLAVLKSFSPDIVQAISDPYREAVDFGLNVEFPDNNLPVIREPLLKDPSDLKTLMIPDPATSPRMSDRLEAIRLFRETVGGEVPIMGWVEGALAEAADLRGVTNLMLDLIERPKWVEVLNEICTEVAIKFAQAQIDAGADIIGLGDAIASQISPEMYRRFALPYEKSIFAAVHDKQAFARLHICGNTNKILADMVESGADIIDLDWMVDMGKAGIHYGDQVSFCGNFDPVSVLMQGTPETVYEATIKSLREGGPRCFSAAGCEVPLNTPEENLHSQNKAIRDFENIRGTNWYGK